MWMIVRTRHQVVAELAVLYQRMGDVDAKPRNPLVEPETQYVLELPADIQVPPIEIGLRIGEVVEVVLTCRLVPLPCRSVEDTDPVIGGLAIRTGIGPYVVVAILGVASG